MATTTTSRPRSRSAGRLTARALDWLQDRLPTPIGRALKQARDQDILLYSAALAFYAIVSVVPLTIVVMWVITLVLGDQRTHQLAEEIRKIAPKAIGADTALERVADLGARLGIISILTALWPATAYGSGLERAFDHLGPRSDRKLEGLRGRGLFFLLIMPTFVLGSLIGSFLGTVALGSDGLVKVAGYVLALVTGFLAATVGLVVIYRIFPPKPLPWRQVIRATLVAGTGISLLSFLFFLFVGLGANFESHYATSGLAGLVLLAVWLFLSNALVLVGYRVALDA
jgi:YihY family inner membrane protein